MGFCDSIASRKTRLEFSLFGSTEGFANLVARFSIRFESVGVRLAKFETVLDSVPKFSEKRESARCFRKVVSCIFHNF